MANFRRIRRKASTDEILGNGIGKVRCQWKEHQRDLLRLREFFQGNRNARSEVIKDEALAFSEHMADAATDSYDRDWALSLLSSDQNALYEIEQALDRIRNGTYGICELTGEPVEAERLQAIPWTRFCARAQAELEARGLAGRTRFGALGSLDGEAGETESEEAEEAEAVKVE